MGVSPHSLFQLLQPEKVNPGREEPAPSRPSASSMTPAVAWPQSAESIRHAAARTEDSNIAGLEIEEIPHTRSMRPRRRRGPFKLGAHLSELDGMTIECSYSAPRLMMKI